MTGVPVKFAQHLHGFRGDFLLCTTFAHAEGLHGFCTKYPAAHCP
jgi:hypothetical protein